MIRTATRHDLPALRELFARANDAPYDLAAVAEEKCFGRGIGGEPVVRVIGETAAAITCGKWLRLLVVDREHRRQGLGTALLEDAEQLGAHRIAAEPGNYFTPGVLTTDAAAVTFFRKRGYEDGVTTANLEVRLRVAESPSHEGKFSATRPPGDSATRVLDFIEREFGRIWRFEASRAFDADLVTMFITEHEGEIAGFAAHDVNNRGLGWFGPTGVAKRLRGLGIGRGLLLASLADLHRLGYGRAVIPWTDAIDFYRRSCGAEPAHQFIAFERHRP